jgi:hypothetical protein
MADVRAAAKHNSVAARHTAASADGAGWFLGQKMGRILQASPGLEGELQLILTRCHGRIDAAAGYTDAPVT